MFRPIRDKGDKPFQPNLMSMSLLKMVPIFSGDKAVFKCQILLAQINSGYDIHPKKIYHLSNF